MTTGGPIGRKFRNVELVMELKNKYWVLRHGRSKPNEKGLIVSHPVCLLLHLHGFSLVLSSQDSSTIFLLCVSQSNGVLEEHGLSSGGVEQAQAAGYLFLKELAAKNIAIDKVRIYCSPFSRTVDTAKAVAEVTKLDVSSIRYTEGLRERHFGPDLELQSHEHYPEIWALDECNPLVGPVGGESVADVAVRLTKVIQQIETDCDRCAVLLVSHGDPLQILQTITHLALCNENVTLNESQERNHYDAFVLSQHRNYALLTGELRELA